MAAGKGRGGAERERVRPRGRRARAAPPGGPAGQPVPDTRRPGLRSRCRYGARGFAEEERLFAREHGRDEQGDALAALDAFLNAAVDSGLVMMNFIRAAEAVGLGCCPISVVRNHIDAIAEIIELPDHVFPVAGMTLGHPVAKGFVSLRLHPAVNLHFDRYDDSNLQPEIAAYDRRRDARFSIPAEKQRDTDTHGVANFYGWSEDKARQVSTTERDQLAAYLKRKGFNLG